MTEMIIIITIIIPIQITIATIMKLMITMSVVNIIVKIIIPYRKHVFRFTFIIGPVTVNCTQYMQEQ